MLIKSMIFMKGVKDVILFAKTSGRTYFETCKITVAICKFHFDPPEIYRTCYLELGLTLFKRSDEGEP